MLKITIDSKECKFKVIGCRNIKIEGSNNPAVTLELAVEVNGKEMKWKEFKNSYESAVINRAILYAINENLSMRETNTI